MHSRPCWLLSPLLVVLLLSMSMPLVAARDSEAPASLSRFDAWQRLKADAHNPDLGSAVVLPLGATKRGARRLDSRLNQLVAQLGQQSPRALADDAPISRDSSVAVAIRVSGDPRALRGYLEAHGALVAHIGVARIEAYVPVTELVALSEQPGVLAVDTLDRPKPAVTSEGVNIHDSATWNGTGITGAGVKVGVIDVGFQGFSTLMGSELPAGVGLHCFAGIGSVGGNLADCETETDHGTAVAEAVMDIAPGASLYISNPGSWGDLQESVQWMASQGVSVINHSVGWVFFGPGDGSSVYADSPLAAVDQAVAAGIFWANAAGNEGASTWTGGYADADIDGFLEWQAGDETQGIELYGGFESMLIARWADSWDAATTDIDLYLLDGANNIVASSEDGQSGLPGDEPFEAIIFTPPSDGTYYLALRFIGGPTPNWIEVQSFSDDAMQYASPAGSIGHPADSANPGMVAVGAMDWSTPGTIEYFSSQGPTRDGRIKPDIVGADRGNSVTYGFAGFSGTSQASPHVAGLGALIKQRFPTFSPADIANYLKDNAVRYGSPVPNNVWGWGLAHLPALTGTDPNAAFDAVWALTDQAVVNQTASYSWFWGPQPNDQRAEQYAESPDNQRTVRYYDKSRMEVNDPNGDPTSPWFVSNGLLTVELVSGNMQLGDNSFEHRTPSSQLVAGDPAGNPGTPSYAAFAPYATTEAGQNQQPDRTGQQVTAFLSGSGQLSSTDSSGITLTHWVPETGHNIPEVFWAWMNDPASGFRQDTPLGGNFWTYVLGLPISEPYWIDSTVGGQTKRVLVQLFQRRVLTYTASNDPRFQVEFGNIGQHYHAWRYDGGNNGGGAPVEGAILYQSDMTDWPVGPTDGIGTGVAQGGAFHVSVPQQDAGNYYAAFTEETIYTNVSVSIDVRLVQGSGETEACLMARAAPDSSYDYALCLTADGRTSARFEWYENGGFPAEPLMPMDLRTGPSAPGEWTTLKLVIRGAELWFYANGVELGHATHASSAYGTPPSSGAAGLYIINAADPTAEFEFRNIVVRAVT